MARNLSEWLTWQETLNPAEIDLGLARVAAVAGRLQLAPPAGRVFTVGGTNGKGSCVAALDALLALNGVRTGVYTSPHLLRYNERVSVAGEPVSDATLVAAFEEVEQARQGAELTYFEFGTLAACCVFTRQRCEAWVLEVGLGGRLDAVNVVDADVPMITTVDLDHQAWLGDTIEAIAAEKAGIFRRGRPALFGDLPVPQAITERAAALDTPLVYPGQGYTWNVSEAAASWVWERDGRTLDGLVLPGGSVAQAGNQALALTAASLCEPRWLTDTDAVRRALASARPPGRQQRHSDTHEWLLDVAHNPQAARSLRAAVASQADGPVTVVLGMLADKQAGDFVRELSRNLDVAHWRWIACDSGGARAAGAAVLATQIRVATGLEAEPAGPVEAALERARAATPAGGLVLVCGSFTVVGPALRWLGLYS